MKKLHIKKTVKTPEILCSPMDGNLLIEGRSIPENSIEFYQPLFDWLDDFVDNPSTDLELNVKLEYFNTSSSKCLVEVFRKLEQVSPDQHTVKINWYYEEDDEDMEDSGRDFKEIISLPIEMHEMKTEDEEDF